jgi:hypothetical protein
MATRLDAFAIDVPRIEKLLDRSLAELFCLYFLHGNTEKLLHVCVDPDTFDSFSITPRTAISGSLETGPGRVLREFAQEEITAVPRLSVNARSHYSDNVYSGQINDALTAFAACDGVDGIVQLFDEESRWWIGSVLQAAEMAWSDRSPKFEECRVLFRKILRGWHCGYRDGEGDIGLDQSGLPFRTDDDDSFNAMGRWTPHDCSRAVELITELLASPCQFECPPKGPTSWNDCDWNEWTRGSLRTIMRLRELNFRDLNLISFIAG